MSYLRTNYRKTGKDLDPDAIGGGVMNFLEGSMGAYAQGGRGFRMYGGLVMMSLIEVQSGLISVTAESILALHYGLTMFSNLLGGSAGASGYRVWPIEVHVATQLSNAFEYYPTLSFSSGNSNFVIVANVMTMSTGPSNVFFTLAGASITQRIVIQGFIVSTPFGMFG